VNRGVVDNAIYVDGVRTANPATLDETYELLRERHGMAWIGLYRPSSDEMVQGGKSWRGWLEWYPATTIVWFWGTLSPRRR
jgi:hypothetical protein